MKQVVDVVLGLMAAAATALLLALIARDDIGMAAVAGTSSRKRKG
jgi:hypothetical protein